MRILAHIATLVVAALLISCSSEASTRTTEPIYTPRYAEGFTIERDTESGEMLLCVRNPWQGAKDVCFYTPLDTLAPAKRIVAMSSSYVAMADAIGCLDRIVGISGCRFISTPSAVKGIEEGRIAEVGYDTSVDFEMIKSLNADVVLLYGVAGESKMVTDKLNELRIPYLYIGDYLEQSPLGKAEWVVALAYLCGVEEQGKALFAQVEERYNTLRSKRHSSAHRPRVMLNLPYRDNWFMPPHGSYMVQLIEDAGGTYILTENGKRKTENGNTSTQSTPISLEEALLLASRADFWINLGQVSSKAELCVVAPRFANIDAVRSNRIYNNTKRTNSALGSDFWESGAVRPDIVLEDLVKILHHEAATEELYYYKKLE